MSETGDLMRQKAQRLRDRKVIIPHTEDVADIWEALAAMADADERVVDILTRRPERKESRGEDG